ncbi:MAG: hypothetical protein QXM31_00095 [Candidatus Woesearchaeota archaeon]
MATTTRIWPGPAKAAADITRQIEQLRLLSKRGFENTNDLWRVFPLLTDNEIREKFYIHISVPFEKVRIPIIITLIKRQIALLQQELKWLLNAS